MFTGNVSRCIHSLDHLEDEAMIHYTNGRIEIAFEGVLYNKPKLGLEGMEDPQAVVTCYEQGGEAALARLDGSFTCIIRTENRLLIMRDHHGTHHQIYHNATHFASSLLLLQATPGCSTTVNQHSICTFLAHGYIPTGDSSFEQINKLAAGSILSYSNTAPRVIPLFDTHSILPTNQPGNLEELSAQYGSLHTAAIQRRIGESRKVGILLSGGYDSGCNLAALRKVYNGDIYSYSIGFKGDNWSELPLAQCMSDSFGTTHEQYEIDGSEILALPKIVRALGDPFVEGGLMVNYAAMRMVGIHKPDIILGGDGSDQYFGTSGREVALHHLASKYGVKPLLTLLHTLLSNKLFDQNKAPYRIRFHLDKILHILEGDLFGFEPFKLRGLIQGDDLIRHKHAPKPDNRSFAHLYTQHTYQTDIEKIINQVILFKATRMSSLFNNRIAFPYMDLELYNFLLQLPVSYKCKGENALKIARGESTAKFLLKHHYKPMLPEQITNKKKQGGFAPMPIFFKDKTQRTHLHQFIMDSSVIDELLKRDGVERFLRDYDRECDQTGSWFWYKQNKAIQYFNLLTLCIWWEEHVKRRSVTL